LHKLLNLRSKIGVGTEISSFRDSLGPLAKLMKIPKKGLSVEFCHLKSYHWIRLGLGIRVFVSLIRNVKDKQELR